MSTVPVQSGRSPRFTAFPVKKTAAGSVSNIVPDPKRFAFEPNQGVTVWFHTAEEAVAALDKATAEASETAAKS